MSWHEANAKTVYTRYQVADSLCGYIEGCQTKDIAMATAALHNAKSHDSGDPDATVYDTMARHGAPEQWHPDGRILSRRP